VVAAEEQSSSLESARSYSKKSEVGYEAIKIFSTDRRGVFSFCGDKLRDKQ